MLQVSETLPISTSAGRTVSTMKHIKTFLMTTDRLTGLTLFNIHQNIQLTPEDVTGHFTQKNILSDFFI